jgi:hypothetical protein
MMDFGQAPNNETKVEPKTNFKKKKLPIKAGLVFLVLLILAGTYYYLQSNKNPLPADIKQQVDFKVIYPSSSNGSLDSSGYVYQPTEKTLNYNLINSGNKIVFTEQLAPNSVGSGNQVYYAALGIHPYAQFESKLGPVALTKFYKAGSLTSQGQSGILVAQGTLLIAHPDKNLTNDQWKRLFDSLKIAQ